MLSSSARWELRGTRERLLFIHSPEVMIILVSVPDFLISTLYITMVRLHSM